MWLTSSSIGRKFIMALTGACLVLFVTFHCVMNAIAIVWPTAYNVICEFLGANWYALVASMGLALLFIIHIIWATMLTLQNRKARGTERYLISKNAPGVEWSSKNMYVLGVVIVAFLAVHLINFWAKMQLAEIQGHEGFIPPQAGTLFLQEAFSTVWVPIVYIIGFVALWFHMNHGFWSMFQTCGWNNQIWIHRLKKIAAWWTTIVVALFVAQAIVFTVQASKDYYKTDSALRDQYIGMVLKNSGMGANNVNFEQIKQEIQQTLPMLTAEVRAQYGNDPKFAKQVEMLENVNSLINYLEGRDPAEMPAAPQMNPMMQMQMAPQQGAPEQAVEGDNQSEGDDAQKGETAPEADQKQLDNAQQQPQEGASADSKATIQ